MNCCMGPSSQRCALPSPEGCNGWWWCCVIAVRLPFPAGFLPFFSNPLHPSYGQGSVGTIPNSRDPMVIFNKKKLFIVYYRMRRSSLAPGVYVGGCHFFKKNFHRGISNPVAPNCFAHLNASRRIFHLQVSVVARVCKSYHSCQKISAFKCFWRGSTLSPIR